MLDKTYYLDDSIGNLQRVIESIRACKTQMATWEFAEPMRVADLSRPSLPYEWEAADKLIQSFRGDPAKADECISQQVQPALDAHRAKREANKVAIAHNARIAKAVTELMDSIGVDREYTVYDTVRGRSKTSKSSAGYLGDLRRVFVTHDRYDEGAYTSLISKLQAWARTVRDEQAEKTRQERERTLTSMLTEKYGIETTKTIAVEHKPTADDLLEAVLDRSKYLRLAHYMELNRGDWSEGCWYAKRGLEGFTTETERDHAIRQDVSSYFDDFDDGRCFRDCEWNYNRLYEIVQTETPELYADYTALMEITPCPY